MPRARTDLPAEVKEQVEIQLKYEGYIQREEKMARKASEMENLKIPPNLDYWKIKTLKFEAKEKLSGVRPQNLGQASRIPGITPADIAVLSIMIRK